MISRAQLLELGVGASAIKRRVAAGRLHPVHRGVYAIGHRRVAHRGRWVAALLACGPRAVLSHRSAAAAWDLAGEGGKIDVMLCAAGGRAPPRGVVLHRVEALAAGDRSIADEIPCTSVARTLIDLAGSRPRRELERACERAEMLRLFDLAAIEVALRRGRKGSRALRGLLAEWTAGETITRSELEERFLALIRAAGLPLPQLNATLVLDGALHVEVDALWPAERLVVELDGRRSHGTRRAFERDRERDVALQRAGFGVARFTWRHLTRRAGYVTGSLADLLRQRPAAAPR